MTNIYQTPDGKWRNSRSTCEFDDRDGAAMDYRFSGEWDKASYIQCPRCYGKGTFVSTSSRITHQCKGCNGTGRKVSA